MKLQIKICLLRCLMFLFILLVGIFLYTGQSTQAEDDVETLSAEQKECSDPTVQELFSLPEVPSMHSVVAESEQSIPNYNSAEMQAINPDFAGWLWIPDTGVNYPVVQAYDNDKYLHTSFQGTYSVFGSLFLDMNCTSHSRSRVIHGHNMGNGRTEMFSSLLNYQNTEWAGERIYAYFMEPACTVESRYQLFAVLNFSVNDLDEFNYFQTEFESEACYQAFVSYLKAHSIYQTPFDPEGDLLILSTCNSRYGEDNRLLVCYANIAQSTSEPN